MIINSMPLLSVDSVLVSVIVLFSRLRYENEALEYEWTRILKGFFFVKNSRYCTVTVKFMPGWTLQ